ncbi:putative restriction/modification enzyme [Halococcus morrhuae DSM 1307]|uniref:site-specific DNA-methyltransferase (adenine-specific) n=1 Tax=Halococcus morrhuae DSM 1307 TaxID=931277 RepID=M0M2E0_HALMO|nr:DNA methyltransferase [Halococcus morrhuae]EMA38774.1 putative restriction/modification enzyme [Halococcus morrhuae DSM 1307]
MVNDDGERKATGAYYTPDYVVTYIVEEAVGPLLSDIEAELTEMDMEPGTQEYVIAFWERVTELKILDPAMGSGHFLTKATGYLAEAMMERVRELETGRLFDEEQVRREISRECIYGVDVNGMAVELAKLSMWLETLAADQPLAFLDHHLKSGNSLVGSDITDVLSRDEGDSGQVTLAYDFAQTRQRALDHVMDLTGELLAIDNETLEDIHSMEELYDDIRADPLYQRLFAMATVHTASEFGFDVPEDAIERMARAIEDEATWADIEAADWFRVAQAMADEEGFFHWELEFPAVFFDSDGERLASAGFDAIVGNPPYGADFNEQEMAYLNQESVDHIELEQASA